MKVIVRMIMASLLFVIAITSQLFGGPMPKVDAFTNQVIQRGATGEDVIELQARLQYNGYYHGKIDGVYGWSTYWAVRNFQQRFGLDNVDGLVGQKTKNMLVKSTKFYNKFVYTQLNKGNNFTHYGGIPLNIQAAPTEEQREKLRQQVEARGTNKAKQYTSQNNGQQSKQQTGQNNGQQPKQQTRQNNEQQSKQQTGQNNEQQPKQQTEQNNQGQEKQQVRRTNQSQQKQQTRPNNQQVKQKQQKPAATNVPGGFSQNDIQLIANAVYGEARGEPYIGQVAIAAVILNRVNSPTFPNTVAGVIFEPRAFTAVSDGQIYLTPNEQAKKAVIDALHGFDPTGNATYYFNPATATSPWVWGRPQIKQIGKHIFCR